MDDLIKIEDIDGELRVSSIKISERLGVEHKNTIEMIRRYEVRLNKYGMVAFKTEPLSTANRGIQNSVVSYLNERQATFLVTLSRNSEPAVDLKQKLTDSYHYYRSKIQTQPALPKTFAESLRLLADQVERTHQLENKIIEDQPLVEFAESIQESNDAISIGEFAKILSKNGYVIGQNNLFKKLREFKLVYRKRGKNIPYQNTIEAGWFKYDEFNKKVTLTETREIVDKLCTNITITGKGQVQVEKKLRSSEGNEQARDKFFKDQKKKLKKQEDETKED